MISKPLLSDLRTYLIFIDVKFNFSALKSTDRWPQLCNLKPELPVALSIAPFTLDPKAITLNRSDSENDEQTFCRRQIHNELQLCRSNRDWDLWKDFFVLLLFIHESLLEIIITIMVEGANANPNPINTILLALICCFSVFFAMQHFFYHISLYVEFVLGLIDFTEISGFKKYKSR